MKKIIWLLLLLFLCANTYGNNKFDQSQALAVSLVLDISPTVKKHTSTITAIQRQVFSSLRPGDYIELISAHHKSGRQRLAQFIKSADTEEIKTLCAIAKNIKYADWLDSDVSTAFYMAYKRLDHISTKQPFGKYIIILLTDGSLKDSEARRIDDIASKCRKRGWIVYITGTYKINRHILTSAAAKDDLLWSPLSKACPAVWLANIRKTLLVKEGKITDKKSPPEKTKPNPPPKQTPPNQKTPLETKTFSYNRRMILADLAGELAIANSVFNITFQTFSATRLNSFQVGHGQNGFRADIFPTYCSQLSVG